MAAFLECRVADVMTCRPAVIAPDTPLADVLRLFEEHAFNSLPVVQDGSLLGLVTRLDVLKALADRERGMPDGEFLRLPAERVMTDAPVTVGPETPLTVALARMVETRHHGLPVVIDALLVGIVTREDVLRAVHRAAAVADRKEDDVDGRADLHA
jgi:CBS domain-containing protein